VGLSKLSKIFRVLSGGTPGSYGTRFAPGRRKVLGSEGN